MFLCLQGSTGKSNPPPPGEEDEISADVIWGGKGKKKKVENVKEKGKKGERKRENR